MSLRSSPKHEFTVIPKRKARDAAGATAFVDLPPVTVRGNAHPLSADELTTAGLQGQTIYRVRANTWPGGMNSTVIWSGPGGIWPGRVWDQVGEALHNSLGVRTRHVRVLIQARSTEIR